MKTKIFALLAILAFTLTASATKIKENNYDDIDNFFATASVAESPGIKHFYISKAMLTLTAGKSDLMLAVVGFQVKDFINKIDFIRNVEISTNRTRQEKELLAAAEVLATKTYRKYNYNNLLTTNEGDGECNYFFYKYGEGGLCSILVISTLKEYDEATEQAFLKKARVILIGGTFRAEDIPSIINF